MTKIATLPEAAKRFSNLLGYEPMNVPAVGGSYSFRGAQDNLNFKLADRQPDDVNAAIKKRVDSLAEMIRQRLAKKAPIGKAHIVETGYFNGNSYRSLMEDLKGTLNFTAELYLHCDQWAIAPSNWLIGKGPLVATNGTDSAIISVFAFEDEVMKNGFIAAR